MKRRLLYIVPILLILASIGASFIQPPKAIAASSAAVSDCNSTESGGSPGDKKSCEQGYDGAIAGKSKIDACPNSMGQGSRDPNSLSQAQCNAGWTDGEGTKGGTPKAPSNPSKAAQQDCNQSEAGSAGAIAACEVGYDTAAAGQPQDPTCAAFGPGSKTLGSSSECDDGYKDDKTVQAQDAACPTSTYPGSQQAACIDGLVAAQAGKDDSVCASKSGSDQTACEAGFKAGGGTPSVVGGSTSPPSCESSGFSLSWIFCPIIEGAANATDSIYSNLVKPLLVTKPIELTNPSSDPTHTYDIWSNFRVYGDIFLVIALLVIVFGESIGGGLIDAYSAKKILPRLLIAAVLINLSIYFVALAVDLTNIIGSGIASLIEAPFRLSGTYDIHIGGATGDLGMGALVTGGVWAVASIGPLLEFLFLFIMIPAFLTFVAILVTVILRQGLIILLVLVSPVAFALYCLPNTEQYFRRWWDLLLRTLLVYPLIAILFALGNVLSVTINSTASGISGSLTSLLSVFALFAPLFLIPYSFRIAGGLLGRFHELATQTRKQGHEALKGNANDPTSWRNMTKRKLSNRVLSQREGIVNKGIDLQKNRRSSFGRTVGGGMATAAGLGNYQLRRSLKNKEASDVVQAQVSTGDDSSVRALFARQMNYRDSNGREQRGFFGTGARIGADGLVVGQTSPQFSEFEVRKARSLAAQDSSFHQAALTYELGKAGDDYELGQIRQANNEVVQASPWLRAAGGGSWKGAGFSQQQSRRELKHESYDPGNGSYSRDSRTFTREVSENVGSWALSNMRTSTIKALQDDHANAQSWLALHDASSTPQQIQQAQATQANLRNRDVTIRPINNAQEAREIIGHVQATANSLDARRQMGGSFALQGEGGDDQVPVSGAQTGAPGHVSEEIQRLIDQAAVQRGG